jgi:hypothetical protein
MPVVALYFAANAVQKGFVALLYSAITTLIDLTPLVLELLDPPLEQDTSAMVAMAAVASTAPKRRDFFMTSSLLVVNARR